ncbi:MAG TPA: glycoside hydrolase family 32 protein [Terriglobales bacterium]|nr:glycoside hydrolase family 32 protein [Terriglobales bacterium]
MRLAALLFAFLSSVAFGQARYSELYRPQYHFSPPQNFMNDANGMVFFQGEYHLFYQHNPEGNVWGHMSWGHAVSPDMVHWNNLPVAIPEHKDYMIFSGSSVVDRNNSSGLCGKEPCLVAIYTAHKEGWQRQNIAYSLDRGRTWKDYEGNPVVDEKKPDFRDPKMFWYEPQKKWVLVTVFADERLARFYESRDLKTWKFMSEFGPAGTTEGQWECPDLVELPIEGTTQKKWVLIISRNPGAPQGGTGVQYFVGNFDGNKFTNETPDSTKLWIDWGKDFYATQRFADLPSTDKRVIWMGWLGNWKYANQEPTSPWRGIQSIPREMFLRRCETGYCVGQRPIHELQTLRGRVQSFKTGSKLSLPNASFEFDAQLQSDQDTRLAITDSKGKSVLIGFDPAAKQIYIDRTNSGEANFSPDFPGKHAGSIASGNKVRLHVFVDQTTIELFANDGDRVMSERVYLTGPVTIEQNRPGNLTGQLWEMHSVWKK